ncbi:MAG: hypothetical protein IJS47_00315 [Clostridia bacterium]|nr:hypothetical protein [Clostridia bacterium]
MQKINFKIIFIFSLLIIIGFCIVFYYIELANTIIITKDNYIEILRNCHDNIDDFVGKKIVVSGYVYLQDNFSFNHFVIAKNLVVMPGGEPYVVGFLCENLTDYSFYSNDTIRIKGKIVKGNFNGIDYPIIQFKNFEFVPYKT